MSLLNELMAEKAAKEKQKTEKKEEQIEVTETKILLDNPDRYQIKKLLDSNGIDSRELVSPPSITVYNSNRKNIAIRDVLIKYGNPEV